LLKIPPKKEKLRKKFSYEVIQMIDKITAIYCLIDDMLKSIYHQEDNQIKMTDAEVLTASTISALYFSGNITKKLEFFKEGKLFFFVLSESRFVSYLLQETHLIKFLEVVATFRLRKERKTIVAIRRLKLPSAG